MGRAAVAVELSSRRNVGQAPFRSANLYAPTDWFGPERAAAEVAALTFVYGLPQAVLSYGAGWTIGHVGLFPLIAGAILRKPDSRTERAGRRASGKGRPNSLTSIHYL